MSERGPTTLFLRNRYLLVLTLVVSVAAGVFGAFRMERLEDPRITNRVPLVVTPFPGASAERVEALITEPIEDELAEVDAIDDITSTSIAGVSVISIELAASVTRGTYKAVFAELRDKIDAAARRFPPGALPPIFDDKRDPTAFSLLVAVRWEAEGEPGVAILDRIAEELADRLRALDGTEVVRLYGAPTEELTVRVDPRELALLGLDAATVAARIAEGDSKSTAGTLRGERSDVQLEVRGEIDSVARIQSIPLREGEDQTVVRIGDVAEVERGWATPETEIAVLDGARSILVAARVDRDHAVDTWSARALEVVADFETTVGDGIGIGVLFEQARYTTERFAELLGNLLLGALVVVAVVLALMGWRLGLVVGAALPVVVGLTVYSLLLLDQSLHQMSVYGIVIALGLLIDNAIVVADEVQKRKAAGLGPTAAVRASVRHLFLPLLASTVTTLLAFLPIVLIPGNVGDFVGSIGMSVCLAVLWSFFVAMTVTPALAGLFARPTSGNGRPTFLRDGLQVPLLSRAFRWTLAAGLRAPVAAIALSLTLPLVGFALAPSLGNSFFPPADRDMFEVRVWLPNDSSIENTRAHAEAVESIVRERPEVTSVSWLVGGSFPRVYYNLPMDQDRSPHFAHAIVGTVSNEGTKAALEGLQAELDERFPSAQILVKQLRQGPPILADVEFRLFGPSVDGMIELGERIRRTLQEDPEVVVTRATMTRGEPKLWFHPDEGRARVAGLSLADVSSQLASLIDGSVGGTLLEDLESIPVRVRVGDGRRGDVAAIASTNLVRLGEERWVPLEALGEFELLPELTSTTRYGGVRTNIVQGYTTIEALPIDVAERVLAKLEREGFELPPGHRIELGGTVEQETETRGDLTASLPMIVVLMVATLVLGFRSVTIAAILGVVALLSVGLAVLSTWLIDLPISFNTFMGTFGLIGVALNDCIVVMSEIRSDPRAARGEVDGLVDAVLGTTRHVLSTTLTTIGGFLPLIVIVGGDFWPSMSIVLAGGIVGASILALFFVPATYRLLRRSVAPRTATARLEPSPLPS